MGSQFHFKVPDSVKSCLFEESRNFHELFWKNQSPAPEIIQDEAEECPVPVQEVLTLGIFIQWAVPFVIEPNMESRFLVFCQDIESSAIIDSSHVDVNN